MTHRKGKKNKDELNEDGRRVAAVLNNAHYLENLHFTIDGVDTHYFVKPGPSEGDLAILGLSGGRRTLENGVNVTVSQINTMLNGRTRRYTDIQLQHGALSVALSCLIFFHGKIVTNGFFSICY